MRRVLRLGALALLYFGQGLPYAFFAYAVPVFLNRSHPPEIVGLSPLLALPWALKFLWAPHVDRVDGAWLGRRKTVILPVQVATSAALVALGFARVADDNLTPLLVGFFVVSLLSATQDIAADGLTMDLLDERERARGGAIQAGAYRAGMIAGGGGVLLLVDYIGFRDAFFLMAAAVGLSALPVLAVREPAAPHAPAPPPGARGAQLSLLRGFFARPDARRILLFLFCFKLGDALAAGMVTRWFVKQGLSNADIGLARGMIGGVAAVVGALLGAWVARLWGLKRSLFVFAALQTSAIAMYAVLALAHPVRHPAAPMSPWVYQSASAVEHLLGGGATAVVFTLMMRLSRDEARATDYTVQASLLVWVTGLGLVASGLVVAAAGLTGFFVIATLVGLLAPYAVARRWPVIRAPGA
jgi:MFS family permease